MYYYNARLWLISGGTHAEPSLLLPDCSLLIKLNTIHLSRHSYRCQQKGNFWNIIVWKDTNANLKARHLKSKIEESHLMLWQLLSGLEVLWGNRKCHWEARDLKMGKSTGPGVRISFFFHSSLFVSLWMHFGKPLHLSKPQCLDLWKENKIMIVKM